MVSTFHGIEMGKRSLITHNDAINVTGQNLNNLNTEGYSRQIVKIKEYEPIFMPDMTREERSGQIGQGSITASIERVRDALLDNRLILENKDLGYYEMRNKYLSQVETVYQEPSVYNDPAMVNTLRTAFDDFMSAWGDLSNHTDEKSARIALVEKSNILTNSVRSHFKSFKDIRSNIDMEVQDKVREVNILSEKIAHLNGKILRSETMKDNPNDWLDERDRLIDRLSKIVDLQISREDNDELILFVGGRHIVQGEKYEKLTMISQADNEGYFDVFWKDGEKLALRGGELAGLFDARDTDLWTEIKKIDGFAANVTDLVNEIHREGFGANGKTGNNFFVQFPYTTDASGNFDRNRDGVDDSTYLFRVSGSNKLESHDKIGIRGTMRINGANVDYYETDTLEQVIRKINDSGARVNAFLNPENRLTIKADYQLSKENPDFVIQSLEDNGLFLTGYAGILNESGANGAYNYQEVDQVDKLRNDSLWSIAPLVNPSAYMKVEDKILADNSFIASASGIDIDGDGVKDRTNGIGDSENSLKIAGLKNQKVMVGMSLTFESYFEYVVSDVGSRSREAEKGFKAAEVIVQNLENMRKSVSGVNIDEEFSNLIKFQHGYNAIAKVISTMDKMLETLMMKLG